MSGFVFDRSTITLFLGGKLRDRLHYTLLEEKLLGLGYKVSVPAREADLFQSTKEGVDEFAVHCERLLEKPEVIYVGEYRDTEEGVDADIDFGIAMGATHRAILYTKHSSDEIKDRMFHLPGVSIIHDNDLFPGYGSAHIDIYYARLANMIDVVVREIARREHHRFTANDVSDTCP